MAKTKEKELTREDRDRIYKEDMNESAQEAVTEIINLEAKSDAATLVHYYQQAVKLRAIAEDKEKYGVDGFENAWKVLGRSERWAEQRVVAARKFDEPLILELAQKRDKSGNAFSWTHLELLTLVDSKSLRRTLINVWAKDGLSSNAFGELVRARIATAQGDDLAAGEGDGEEGGGDSGEGGESGPAKSPLRIVKHSIAAVKKTVESFADMKKWSVKKLPLKERQELITLHAQLDTLLETVNSLVAKLPLADLKSSIEEEEASAAAVLGHEASGKEKGSKAKPAAAAAKTVKAPKVNKQTAAATTSADDDDLFGDVGGDAPVSTDPADLVPIHSTPRPNRSSAKKKKGGKKPALATTGPGKDKRRG